MSIIGLDPSVRRTGVVVLSDGALRWTLIDTTKTKLVDPGRHVYIADQVVEFVGLSKEDQVLLVIEGTGNPQGANRVNLELHAVLRIWLADRCRLETLVVAPTSLKKFTTGNGRAQKGEIGAHVMRRWGDELPEVPPEDVLEAFSLLKVGQCRQDPDGPWTEFQRSVVERLTAQLDSASLAEADRLEHRRT